MRIFARILQYGNSQLYLPQKRKKGKTPLASVENPQDDIQNTQIVFIGKFNPKGKA